MPTRESEIVVSVQQILDQVRQVVVGKDEALLWALAAILAGGHILLEDIPGVGKTTMALSFARALDLEYGRIQFTPDVLPSGCHRLLRAGTPGAAWSTAPAASCAIFSWRTS